MRYNLEFKVKAFPYTNWYVWIVGNQLIEIGTTVRMLNDNDTLIITICNQHQTSVQFNVETIRCVEKLLMLNHRQMTGQ